MAGYRLTRVSAIAKNKESTQCLWSQRTSDFRGNNCDLEKLFAPFGFVESSVIRYRPPLGDREHRSWALVAFENAGMLEKLLESNAYTTMQVACRQSECLFRILQHPGDPSMQSLMLFEMSCIIDMIHYRDQQ